MPRKLPKSLASFLIPKLRRLSRWWPYKGVALDLAKVFVPDGKFKNGNAKHKIKYVCAECKRQDLKKLWNIDQVQVDHIHPVVGVKGFTNWDDYLNNLFCDSSKLQVLCLDHHQEKTQQENSQRVINRANKKKVSKVLTNKRKKVII